MSKAAQMIGQKRKRKSVSWMTCTAAGLDAVAESSVMRGN